MTDRLYFNQLLSGSDFAVDDPVAKQMVNFTYIIGDTQTREAIIVDPAWKAEEIVDIAEADDMTIVGALATHHHPDHVGGSMMGMEINGIAELLARTDVPIHVNENESEWVKRVTGVGDDALVGHTAGDTLMVGDIEIELIHTPGHTPGSQCFFVNGEYLVAGDTLFLDGCGRTDLPGGDPAELYASLTQRLAKVPDTAVLFPGHLYSPAGSQSMGDTRQRNMVFKPKTEAQWLSMFGH